MKNMTLAFLTCMAITTPSMAESKLGSYMNEGRPTNTKELFDNSKTISSSNTAKQPIVPATPHTNMPASVGNPDQDFARQMIPHHQSAVDMARAELAYGKDPEMKKLAKSILDSQAKEIEQMQKWLSKHK